MVAPSRVAGSRADYVFPRLDWSHDRREDNEPTGNPTPQPTQDQTTPPKQAGTRPPLEKTPTGCHGIYNRFMVTVVEKAPAVAGPGLADRDDECGDSRPIGPKP